MFYRNFFKRAFDFLIAYCILLFASPALLVIVSILFCKGGFSNVFFTQARPGRNGKIFRLIKFKTMSDKTDTEGRLLPDSKRITRVGKFLRSSSLDELPQLFNVIKGEMSIVGPRPLLVKYLSLYSEYQARRHEVLPGITGWAQVNGRNAISWEQKFNYDVWYVDNLTFVLDLKIIFLTVIRVFERRGINKSEVITMSEFKGNSGEHTNI